MSEAETEIRKADLLLVLPLRFRRVDGHVYFDRQSRASLDRHLKSFDSILMALVLMDEADVDKPTIFVWDLADDLLDRVQFVALPSGGVRDFIRDYGKTAKLLRRCIDAADRLLFAIGGAGGLHQDWGQVAAEEAIKAGRSFALHADWNSFGVWNTEAGRAKGLKEFPRRMKLLLKGWLTKQWQSRLVSRCDLMVCNGLDTKLAYTPFVRSPEIAFKLNDFQIGPDKFVTPEQVEAKCQKTLAKPEIEIIYAGRVAPMKGPIHWVHAIQEAVRLGARIKATWLGDGPILDEMRREVEKLGLGNVIRLPGFVSDRDEVIDAIRAGDIFMFAHLDPESPRVLIESLISATPIVGYLRNHPKEPDIGPSGRHHDGAQRPQGAGSDDRRTRPGPPEARRPDPAGRPRRIEVRQRPDGPRPLRQDQGDGPAEVLDRAATRLKFRLAVDRSENRVGGGWQVGHDRVGEIKVGLRRHRLARPDQEAGATARVDPRQGVADHIPDHPRPANVQAQLATRPQEHPRPRLAVRGVHYRRVVQSWNFGAIVNAVKRHPFLGELPTHLGVDLLVLLDRDHPSADRRLVGDHHQGETGLVRRRIAEVAPGKSRTSAGSAM